MYRLEELGIELLWFDSLGAKCSSIAITTSHGLVVIDPGVAEMQPSYPLPAHEKQRLRAKALSRIESCVSRANIVIVTHYHYDHHVLPSDPMLSNKRLFQGKALYLKNPNTYINESQWKRARLFISELDSLASDSIDRYITEPKLSECRDPVEGLTLALSKDFGDYSRRRAELLEKGREWFRKLCELWSREPWIEEHELRDGTKILWAEGRTLDLGDTEIVLLEPWFHGIEYDRTGWIVPIVVKKCNRELFFTSDVMGPAIEDYAEFIARSRADIVILDGPPTYLFPYMLNRINLRRAIDNAITIVCSRPRLVIYDHHLLREKRWRQRVADVFREAEKCGSVVMTAAEYLGKVPLIDTL